MHERLCRFRLQAHFVLHDTAPGALICPPPKLNLSQHCPESAMKTPALQPDVAWHSAQQTSFEPAGRASSLAGNQSTESSKSACAPQAGRGQKTSKHALHKGQMQRVSR